jgi:hypothetical protein
MYLRTKPFWMSVQCRPFNCMSLYNEAGPALCFDKFSQKVIFHTNLQPK